MDQSGGAAVSDGFLSYKAVAEMTSLSTRTIRRKVESGEFPKPIQYGARTLFVRAEVAEWCDDLVTKLRENPHSAA